MVTHLPVGPKNVLHPKTESSRLNIKEDEKLAVSFYSLPPGQ